MRDDDGRDLRVMRSAWRGLSGRLLLLTFACVMLVEVMIFVPSAANFRTQWLEARVERAYTAALATQLAPPDAALPTALVADLLESAEVVAVAVKRDGARELILRGPPFEETIAMVDLRRASLAARLYETCMTLLTPERRILRVIAAPRMEDEEFLEVLVREAPLKNELLAFSWRIFVLSIIISLSAAAAVYAMLLVMIVRPVRGMAAAMTRFSAAPEDAGRVIQPSGRRDEIGQAEEELASLQSQVRAALKQRERLAALGEAVAKINHDLRNVLTTAQLISDRLTSNRDPSVRQQAERMVRAVDRGVRLAEDVLRYGRSHDVTPEPRAVTLRPILEEAFQDAAAAAGTPTGLDLRVEDGVRVLADPEHVHRIALNIMRNAVQAMAARPADERAARPSMVTISAGRVGELVRVVLADTGPGVPPAAQAGLFTPFAGSTRKGGSGLGLSIADELARAQGGAVRLAGSSDAGAQFELLLPVAD